MHETARNLQLIRDFTDDSDFRPKLYPSPADYSFVDTWASGKFITISPASVWFTKQFPGSKWIPFIDHIPSGYEIYLLGGPGDKTLCKNILESCTRGNLHVLGGLILSSIGRFNEPGCNELCK
jgi:heptosyltransferase-2